MMDNSSPNSQSTQTATVSEPMTPQFPDPVTEARRIVSAFGNDPEQIKNYLKSQYPDTAFAHVNGKVYYGPPSVLNADNIPDVSALKKAYDQGQVREYSPGFLANTIANGPEVGLSTAGGVLAGGLASPSGPGAVGAAMAGSAAGGAAGNAIKQGIGKIIGMDDRPILGGSALTLGIDPSRALELALSAGTSAASEGLGRAVLSPVIRGIADLPPARALLPSQMGQAVPVAGKLLSKVGNGIESLNNKLGSIYPASIKKSNDSAVTNFLLDFGEMSPNGIVDTNKELADAIPKSFKAQTAKAGALFDSVKDATQNIPANIQGLVSDTTNLMNGTANEDFKSVAGDFLNKISPDLSDKDIAGTPPPQSLADLINLKQGLSSEGYFKPTKDRMFNAQLQKLKNALDDTISNGIEDKDVLGKWNQANDIYSKTMQTYQPLLKKLGANADNNGISTFEKVIMPPTSKYAPNMSLGQIPDDLQNLVDKAAYQRIGLNGIDPESGKVNYRNLLQTLNSPEKFESLKQVVSPDQPNIKNMDQIQELVRDPRLFGYTPPAPTSNSVDALLQLLKKVGTGMPNHLLPVSAMAYQPFTTAPKLAAVNTIQPTLNNVLQQFLAGSQGEK